MKKNSNIAVTVFSGLFLIALMTFFLSIMFQTTWVKQIMNVARPKRTVVLAEK